MKIIDKFLIKFFDSMDKLGSFIDNLFKKKKKK